METGKIRSPFIRILGYPLPKFDSVYGNSTSDSIFFGWWAVWALIIHTVYGHGSQSGVRGPPGVIEGVPGGIQLNDGIQINPYLFVTLRSVQMEPNVWFHLYTSQSYKQIRVNLDPII